MNRSDIPVEIPCNQRWSTMTREGQKRFCEACKKHVHDLSALSPTQAKTLLAAETTEGLCVRYLYDEAGNVLFRLSQDLVAPSALARMRRFVTAAGVLALPLSLNACMGTAMPKPVPSAPPVPAVTAVPSTSELDGGDANVVTIPTGEMPEPSSVTPVVQDDGPPYRKK